METGEACKGERGSGEVGSEEGAVKAAIGNDKEEHDEGDYDKVGAGIHRQVLEDHVDVRGRIRVLETQEVSRRNEKVTFYSSRKIL